MADVTFMILILKIFISKISKDLMNIYYILEPKTSHPDP